MADATEETVAHGRRAAARPAGAPRRPRLKPAGAAASGWGTARAPDMASESKHEPVATGQVERLSGHGDGVERIGADGVEAIAPDIDDGDMEGLAMRVAEAPRHVGRRVQTMAELRGQMDFVTKAAVGAATTQEKPPDLSCLTSALAPPEAVEEDDTVWDPERLLQTLAQAATADAEANAVAERAVASAAAAAAQTASATTAAVTAVTRRR